MLFNKRKEKDEWSIEKSVGDFLKSFFLISKWYNVKDRDNAKIVIYRRKGHTQIITVQHDDHEIKELTVGEPKKDSPKDIYLISKDTHEKKFTCRLLSQDHENDIFLFLVKPETEQNNGEEKNNETKQSV
jgi:hypothetical protein